MVRTEADEVTYCFHIILRYEMEKAIFYDHVPVEKLPELWNQKMQQYPDLLTCGVYRDYVDMQNIRTKEFNGKTVAFLSYTENTNGYSLPSNSELEIIYTSQEDLIQQQIAAAKGISDPSGRHPGLCVLLAGKFHFCPDGQHESDRRTGRL